MKSESGAREAEPSNGGSSEDLFADWVRGADALSQFVGVAGLEGILLSSFELGAPWLVGPVPSAPPVLHFLREGSAFLEVPGVPEPAELHAGDIVLLPRGGPYTLSDRHPRSRDEVTSPEPTGGRAMCSVRIGGGGAVTRLTCCAYRFLEPGRAAPLLGFLPPLILVTDERTSRDVRATLDELSVELEVRGLGSHGIVARLAELAYLRILRHCLDEDSSVGQGLICALSDPQIGRALRQIHAELGTPWTVASLAASVGMSRAAFAEVFVRKVGESPVRYLQRCRIHEAARLITTTDLSLGEIGRRVGYSDATAFSRAFRRETGRSAREYRREDAS